jgi:MFS family permease
MLFVEIVSWLAMGTFVALGYLCRPAGRATDERGRARSLAVGALTGLGGGALARLSSGEASLLGSYSVMALLVSGVAAMLALGLGRQTSRTSSRQSRERGRAVRTAPPRR